MKRIFVLLGFVLLACQNVVMTSQDLSAQTIKQGDVSVELLRDHNTVVIESQHGRYSTIYAVDYQDPEVSLAYIGASETGGSGRGDSNFAVQNAPKEVLVRHKDYSNSGFTRGHMIPNNMFNFSSTFAKDTFAVYNICPQWQNTNGEGSAWYLIENQIEVRAKTYGKVYIITGPIFDKKPSEYGAIGPRNDIVIPEKFYKVLISYDTKKKQFVRIEAYVFEHKMVNSEKDTGKCLISKGLDFDDTLRLIATELKLKVTLDGYEWKFVAEEPVIEEPTIDEVAPAKPEEEPIDPREKAKLDLLKLLEEEKRKHSN